MPVRVPDELTKGQHETLQKTLTGAMLQEKLSKKPRVEKMLQCAAAAMNKLRVESKIKWDGTKEIRKWRRCEK